jgi:CheY-like chemotaxis protein
MADSARPRILLLEDCEDDAALLTIELSAAGIDAEVRRVATAPDFRAALSIFAPDLVVSDANLPGYSGLEALALVRAQAPDTPFVFLTGDEDKPAAMQDADAILGKDEIHTAPTTIARLLLD